MNNVYIFCDKRAFVGPLQPSLREVLISRGIEPTEDELRRKRVERKKRQLANARSREHCASASVAKRDCSPD